MARDRKREAFEAGLQNPLIGDIGPLQRLYGTVSAIGEELGGGDMGTPFGQRFAERQRATKAEVKRLQELRKAHPEEFGRGQMFAQEQADPYMLGLGVGSMGAMRPMMGATSYTPLEGEAPAGIRALPAPAQRMLAGPQAAPEAAYYRSVPPEMGTSPGPMNAFNQNMYGLTTNRYGARGYAPEMAVTDYESYGPMAGRTSPETWGRPLSKFDENMLAAYRQGRYNRMGERPTPMGGDYTLEELGSAVAPYRQGGLVYEPVGPQGAAPRQIGGPQGAPRLGYERGPIEGEFTEVRGIGGPRAQGYRGGMDFGVTREGMAQSPTGAVFGPAAKGAAAGLAGYGLGQMFDRGEEAAPAAGRQERRALLPPIDIYGRGATTALSGAPVQAPATFAGPVAQPRTMAPAPTTRKGGKKAGTPLPPSRPEDLRAETPFEPNLNYLVTQALDRLLGGAEAERGRQTQRYYEQQGYY